MVKTKFLAIRFGSITAGLFENKSKPFLFTLLVKNKIEVSVSLIIHQLISRQFEKKILSSCLIDTVSESFHIFNHDKIAPRPSFCKKSKQLIFETVKAV